MLLNISWYIGQLPRTKDDLAQMSVVSLPFFIIPTYHQSQSVSAKIQIPIVLYFVHLSACSGPRSSLRSLHFSCFD